MTSFTERSDPLGKADIVERGWLHETHPALNYRYVVLNRLMRDDEYGIEISQRRATASDVICGARTIAPGNSFGDDLSVPHEVVCIFAGDHGEAPHIGVSDVCVNLVKPGVCSVSGRPHFHLVIDGFAIRPEERADRQERATS